MIDEIKRLQDWYKINCDGDWEHSYGIKIETLDNPGWSIGIDLSETSLESLEYKKDYQNEMDDNNWFQISTANKALNIFCGPENFKQVLEIFFEEIIPKFSDTNFFYQVYLLLKSTNTDIWTPAKATLVSERKLRIIEIDKVIFKNIKVKNVETIDFDQAYLNLLSSRYSIGDVVEVKLEEVYDGLILTAI